MEVWCRVVNETIMPMYGTQIAVDSIGGLAYGWYKTSSLPILRKDIAAALTVIHYRL